MDAARGKAWNQGVAVWLAMIAVGCSAVPSTSGGGGGGGGDGGVADGGPGCLRASDCASMNGYCTQGACVNGTCESLAAQELGACDDGLFCTIDDTCQRGICVGGLQRFCPSSDSCHVGACDVGKGACVEAPGNEGALCDTKDPCTLAGTCNGGVCMGAPAVDCAVLTGPCTLGTCDPAVGCVATPANEGGSCNDAKSEFCTMGQCTMGQCKTVPANEGKVCDDGLFCTEDEVCQGGACGGGKPKACVAPSVCWIALCDEASKACASSRGNDGASCDDGITCTTGTACMNGACLGGSSANDGMACKDELACTTGEVCAAGACTATTGTFVYFVEEFASNAKGWSLGPEWGIGPAKASSGGSVGSDPAEDHTATADNGIAGVVIGGNASTAAHPYVYLESPPFDTSAAPGSVFLSFYRWLNSDFAPHMNNVVEVWDGTAWVTRWESGPPPWVQDSPPTGGGWTFVQHDVTAYKNAVMRVRFGFTVGSAPLKVGSWNVDDVVVADVACP